jgi:hypothetical protein
MPEIPIKDAVERGKFKFQKITTKKIDTGTLTFVNFLFEYEGNVMNPLFECPEMYFPRGIRLNEHNKWTGLGVHRRENEESMNLVETEEHSRKVGFCKESLLNIEYDIGTATASPKDGDVEVFKSLGGKDVSFVISEGETVKVLNKTKIGKVTHVEVATEGTRGYLQMIQYMQAEVLFEHKEELNLRAKTVEEVLDMFKHPIWWPINKETKELDHDKDPSQFPQFKYFKNDTQENIATISLVGTDETLGVADLDGQAFNAEVVINPNRVFVKANDKKIISQTKINSAVISEFIDAPRRVTQSATLARLNASVSEEKKRKNLEILARARKASPREEAGSKEQNSGGEDDLDAIMNGGSVTADVEINLDDELSVPGLDD